MLLALKKSIVTILFLITTATCAMHTHHNEYILPLLPLLCNKESMMIAFDDAYNKQKSSIIYIQEHEVHFNASAQTITVMYNNWGATLTYAEFCKALELPDHVPQKKEHSLWQRVKETCSSLLS